MRPLAACPFDDAVCRAGLCRVCCPRPERCGSDAEKRRTLETMIGAVEIFTDGDREIFQAALDALPA